MPGIYNPCLEATNLEQLIAGHWECLRRNVEFRAISRRWVSSERFRHAHALSHDYHDQQHHTPRCAWDWMLTPTQRVELATYQIEKLYWFRDREYNFGPIICRENLSPAALTRENLRELHRVEPMTNAPPPITIDDAWDVTPDLFQEQFRTAHAPGNDFGEATARLKELGSQLQRAALKLVAADLIKDLVPTANWLIEVGRELNDWAEFSKVFKIPRSRCSEKQFDQLLSQIRQNFRSAGLLVSTRTYETHKSYQGTDDDWRWFLEAERLALDIRKSADLAELARLYSEDLRRRTIRGAAPLRAKAHGFTGSKFSSKVIKNRRRVVKRHVLSIEKWIRAAYPRRSPEPGGSSS